MLGDLSRVEELLESSLSENADNHRLQPLQGRTGLKLQGYIHVQSAAHGKNMGIIIEIIASNITKPIHRNPKYPASNFVENIHFTVIKSYKWRIKTPQRVQSRTWSRCPSLALSLTPALSLRQASARTLVLLPPRVPQRRRRVRSHYSAGLSRSRLRPVPPQADRFLSVLR